MNTCQTRVDFFRSTSLPFRTIHQFISLRSKLSEMSNKEDEALQEVITTVASSALGNFSSEKYSVLKLRYGSLLGKLSMRKLSNLESTLHHSSLGH